MNSENILKAKNIKAIIFIAVIILAISLIVSLVQTPKYQTSAKLLVVINQDNIDPYAASRTADYIANILSEVVYSNSFLENVLKSNFGLNDNLGLGQEKRLKAWKQMVRVRTKENKGIIFINVLNSDKNQTNQFTQAISYLLITKNNLYHGLGNKVEIKLIDGPIVSDEIAQPKIVYNGLLGLTVGLVLGFTFIIIFPEQKLFDISFGRHRRLVSDETIEFTNQLAFAPRPSPDEIPASRVPADQNQPAGANNYYDW
jgi:capsular polysaccharide biosynthesis protein